MTHFTEEHLIPRVTLMAAFLAVALLAVGCSSGDSQPTDSQTTTPAGSSGTTGIVIDDFQFMPSTTTIQLGDTLEWTNTQGVSHTTTSSDGLWDSGSLGTDATFSHTFDEAGEFAFFCSIHPSMTGTITVQG